MSTIPGYDLEDFIAWNYDIKVEGRLDPNPSMQLAEAFGTATNIRKGLCSKQFFEIVSIFEPYREQVELSLTNYREDYMSWRDYASVVYDCIPNSKLEEGLIKLKAILASSE